MVLVECLFQIEKCNDMTAMSNGVYDFWSVGAKNKGSTGKTTLMKFLEELNVLRKFIELFFVYT